MPSGLEKDARAAGYPTNRPGAGCGRTAGGAGDERRRLERQDARDWGRRRDDDPAPPRPAAVEPLALARGHRARHHLDSGRVRGHSRRRDREHAYPQGRAWADDPPSGLGRHLLPRRRDRGRVHLRLPHRPLRTEEPVHDHARDLSRLHRRFRSGVELLELRRFPLAGRGRHRRGVLRDQLRHRRADPGASPRPRCACDQRQLVGRDRGGCLLLLRPASRTARVDRLAPWILRRRNPRARNHHHPPLHPREPALAAHARTCGGGRAGG